MKWEGGMKVGSKRVCVRWLVKAETDREIGSADLSVRSDMQDAAGRSDPEVCTRSQWREQDFHALSRGIHSTVTARRIGLFTWDGVPSYFYG
jgi:hypothetical protein